MSIPSPTQPPVADLELPMIIDGRRVSGAATLDVINPATGRSFARCARADAGQLDAAIAAAKAAFSGWAATPIGERRALLLKIADALAARIDEFARLLTCEQGKPLSAARHEVMGSVALLRGHASLDLPDRVLRENDKGRIVRRQTPLGVVAAITAWNFPLTLTMNKVPPALLAGNTVVLKPAPTTPLTTLLFGALCADILPPGVLNVIVDDNDLGAALTQHPDVAKVTFTGSTATGKKVLASVAEGLKRVTLELGGNDAAILLDDIDVQQVAPRIYNAAMYNAGQICIAIKRVYVHENHYDAMCQALAAMAERTVVGDGMDADTQMGPLQNRTQFDKVRGIVDEARSAGTIIAGGHALEREGYFVRPTIVRDIADDARLVREEQFGPVLPVLAYRDLDDAIARANATDYGLGSSVWSADAERAYAAALRVDAGTVWVNKHLEGSVDIPFSGAKQSGFGVEMGQDGLEEFTQTRIINVGR